MEAGSAGARCQPAARWQRRAACCVRRRGGRLGARAGRLGRRSLFFDIQRGSRHQPSLGFLREQSSPPKQRQWRSARAGAWPWRRGWRHWRSRGRPSRWCSAGKPKPHRAGRSGASDAVSAGPRERREVAQLRAGARQLPDAQRRRPPRRRRRRRRQGGLRVAPLRCIQPLLLSCMPNMQADRCRRCSVVAQTQGNMPPQARRTLLRGLCCPPAC